MPGRPQVIITADDFGRDESCTHAIADALRSGAITATSIMANGGCFALACQIAKHDGLAGRVGVHLVLDEGPALSPAMRRFTDQNGHLRVRRSIRPLGGALSQAVEAELTAQIEAVLAAGIVPTHLDSHRHIHTAWPIGRLVVKLARRFGVPYVRAARNLAARERPVANAYKWLFNRFIVSGVGTSDHFADIIEFYERPSAHSASGIIELMIHLDDTPRGLQQRQLLQDPDFRRFIGRYHIVTHADVHA
jgi:predicted glycoside hydrolase/deacetylase ChbG (UPF0249 family)